MIDMVVQTPTNPEGWPANWIAKVLGQSPTLPRERVVEPMDTYFIHPGSVFLWWCKKTAPQATEGEVRNHQKEGAGLVDMAKSRGSLAGFLWTLFEARAVDWNDIQFGLAIKSGLPSSGVVRFWHRLPPAMQDHVRSSGEIGLLEASLFLGLKKKTMQVLRFKYLGLEEATAQKILEESMEMALRCGVSGERLSFFEKLCLNWKHALEFESETFSPSAL